MSLAVFELMASLGLNTSEFDSGLDQSERKAEGWGSKFSTVAKVGAAAMAATTAAVGAFGVSAVKTSMEFDSSMSQVMATMGYSVDELNTKGSEASETFNKLSSFAQEMGATTAFSASESAEALNYMALAGYDAETSMQMLPTVLDLAAAGGMELADASDMVTDAQSALGLSIEETTEMVNKMAKTSSITNTSVSQLGSAILTVGGTAKDLAGGTTELSAALGVLANSGIKGAEGGTALRNILLSLTPKSDDAAAAMERLGFNAYDADGNLRPLNETFADLAAGLDGMSTLERQNALSAMFNKVDLKSVNAMLAAASDGVDKLSYSLEAAAIDWEKYDDTVWMIDGGGIEAFADQIRYALTEAGSTVEETVNFIASEYDMTVEDATEAVNAISEALDGSQSSWQGFEEAINNAAGAASDMAEVQLSNLKGELTLFNSAWEGFQIAAVHAVDESEGSLRDFVHFASSALSDITVAINEGGLSAGFAQFGEIAQGAFDGIVERIHGFADTIRERSSEIIPVALEMINNFTANLRENAGQMIDAGLDLILSLAQGIADNLPAFIQNLPDIVSNIAGIINDNLPKILETGLKIIVTLGVGLVKAIPALIANIPSILKAIFDVFMAFNWLHLGGSVIKAIGSGFKETATHLPQLLKDIGNNAVEWMKAINWKTLGSDIIDLIKIGIEALVHAIPNALKTIGHTAVNWMKSIDWISLGKNIVLGIIEGIGSAAGWLIDKVVSIGQNALDAVKNFFGIASPSKVMRDQVGKMLAEGIGIGFEKNLPIKGMKETLQEAMDSMSDVDLNDYLFGGGDDEVSIETIGLENDGKGSRYPADNVTINIYPREDQDERKIAEEVLKYMTLWDNQKKRVYA